MMQSTQPEYYNDPALLVLLQSLGNQTSLGRQQEDQLHAQQHSIESILQQVQLLQAFQELSEMQRKDGQMQAEEEQEGQRYGDENSDQNTQQGQQNLPSAHALPEEELLEKEIDSGKEKKRDTISILGMDPSTEASLCQEIFNSLISAAAGQQQQQQPLAPNNQLLPVFPSAYPIDKTTSFQVENPQHENNNNTSNEMQLFQFLQSCLTLDQLASAAVAAAVSSTSNTHQNSNTFNLNNSNESTLTHKRHVQVLQTPTSSINGFKSTNETTHNQSWSASNSRMNMRTSNDINILQSVNANLNAQFNMSASTLDNHNNKSTSISSTSTPPKIQHTFIPTVLSHNFSLEGFESLDSLAAAQLSLQALIASGLNDPNLLRFQHQKRLERQFKIERYKNKRRNWIRKISYDCRKRVADSRLRVKGRFISKKDTQNIKPNGAEESSYQTDNYAQNSNFSDPPKQNNHSDTRNIIVSSKYNPNSDKKSDETRYSSGSCVVELTNALQRKNLLMLPSKMNAIKQRIQMKKPIFALRIHQKQSPKEEEIFPSDNQCLALLDNQIPTTSSSKTASSNEQYFELQTPV